MLGKVYWVYVYLTPPVAASMISNPFDNDIPGMLPDNSTVVTLVPEFGSAVLTERFPNLEEKENPF